MDATINEIKRRAFKRVLIFGTAITLRSGLYEKALTRNGIKAIVPSDKDISIIGDLIYPNLENISVPILNTTQIHIDEIYRNAMEK